VKKKPRYCVQKNEISITGWFVLQSQFITGKYSEALKMWCTDLILALMSLQFNFRTPLCARTARSRVHEEGGELLTVK